MASICPQCTADPEALEEETSRFCIHEKLGAATVAGFVLGFVTAGLL